jgi:hypothetical protein
MLMDVNRIVGRHPHKWISRDRYNPVKSREMFTVFQNHYNKGASYELMAKKWKQEPKWDRTSESKIDAIVYWHKVQKQLDNYNKLIGDEALFGDPTQ